MKKIALTVIILIFLLPVISQANTPYQFLRLNSSARAAGLAGCFVSMTDDGSALFYNPATISTVKDKKFTATFLKHVLDINSGQVSYISKFEDSGPKSIFEKGVFAASVSYLNYGSFDRADGFGNRQGDFGASDLGIAASYSNILDTNLYYGVTLGFIYNYIEELSSTAFAVDAGIIYLMPDIQTNIGASILHAGGQLSSYGAEGESLPLDVRIGINHRLKGLPLLVNFSLHHLADNTDGFFDRFKNFALAGELYLGNYIRLRLGYDNQIRQLLTIDNDRKLSGFTGGVGIKANTFNLDYGISVMGSSAYLHRFSLSFEL
ncbi:MAG: PorV/PorQ family protein [Bacteroidota bacterium]|nr:PorV/PorQ family protein [Bacteroidota bacterium]